MPFAIKRTDLKHRFKYTGKGGTDNNHNSDHSINSKDNSNIESVDALPALIPSITQEEQFQLMDLTVFRAMQNSTHIFVMLGNETTQWSFTIPKSHEMYIQKRLL